MVHLREILLM